MSELIWARHNGQECPVGPNTRVFIVMRSDDDRKEAVNRVASPAYRLRWEYLDRGYGPYPSGGDIVEYAIALEG